MLCHALRIAIVRLGATPLICPQVAGTFGGAEVRAWTIACGLARRPGWRVRMAVQGDSHLRPHDLLGVQVCPVRWRRRSHERSRGLPLVWQLPADTLARTAHSMAARLTSRPLGAAVFRRLPVDVLASFGLQDPTATVVQSARQSGKHSLVFLTSDEDTRQVLAAGRNVPCRAIARQRFALEHADLIVAQTALQRDLVQEAGLRTVLVRNPIDTRVSEHLLTPLSQRKYMLWIGRADDHEKRVDLCWQLARANLHVPWVAVVNPAPGPRSAQLIQAAPPNVKVLTHVPWQQSDLLFHEALALINTSDCEGFPNTFLQAAKHALPVLSRRVDPDQVLTRQGIGWVANDRMSHLANTVFQLHADPRRFQPMADAARAYVVRQHAVDACVGELSDALADLVNWSRPLR